MKQTTMLLLLSLALVACHKKTEPATPVHIVNNTDATPNVATSIDSAAVAQNYEVDVYTGRFIDAGYGPYGSVDTSELSFFIRYTTTSTVIFTCSRKVQVDDIDWQTGGITTYISDSVLFTGPGDYKVGRITYSVYGTNIGDALRVSWTYDDNNHPSDAEHDCSFVGVRVK